MKPHAAGGRSDGCPEGPFAFITSLEASGFDVDYASENSINPHRSRGDRDHRGDLIQGLADLPLRNLNVEIIL
jgi:hypothetical protein